MKNAHRQCFRTLIMFSTIFLSTHGFARDLFLVGNLDIHHYKYVENLHIGVSDRVFVSSMGGDDVNAIKIAEILRISGAKIIIKNVCGGSCVYILGVKNTVSVDDGVIILLSGNTHVMSFLYRDYPLIVQKLAVANDLEYIWAKNNNIDVQFFDSAYDLMKVICYVVPDEKAIIKENSAKYVSWYAAFVPSPEFLRNFGFSFQGNWVVNEEYKKLIKNRYPLLKIKKINFNYSLDIDFKNGVNPCK